MPWQPSISPKQKRLIDLCHRDGKKTKFILCSGPRLASKTRGCLHAICEHAWNIPGAVIGIVPPTNTTAADQGSWTALTKYVIPEWIAGDFGMEWATEPSQSGVTKKFYCELRNRFGGTSLIQVDPLQFEDDVEDRFKNKNYSMLYVPELSYWKKRETFDKIQECLRDGGAGWTDNQFLFLGDTNPAPEGEASWIWQLWYEFATREDLTDAEKEFASQVALLDFSIDDNPYLSQQKKDEQYAKYVHNSDLLARYYFGRWVSASGEGVFAEQFRPAIHVIGEAETPGNKNPDIILPTEGCQELVCGWDPAEVNHAFHILERENFETDDPDMPFSKFYVLDEVVDIGHTRKFSEFLDEVIAKREFWEKQAGHPLMWRDWSDRSAFDILEPFSNLYYHQLINAYSRGKIILRAADRRPWTVQQRVDITKKVMFEQRLVICRSRCPQLIQSLQSLPPGKGMVAVAKTSKWKHAFDSFSYALSSECSNELFHPRRDVNVGKPQESNLVAVPL